MTTSTNNLSANPSTARTAFIAFSLLLALPVASPASAETAKGPLAATLSPVVILQRLEPRTPEVQVVARITPRLAVPPITIVQRLVPATPLVSAPVDQAAIAARDTRMMDTLVGQSIAQIMRQGLADDGETTQAERAAVEAFYRQRDHEPLFLAGGQLSRQGAAVLHLFEQAEDYGLNPLDFENAAFIEEGEHAADARAAARADIAMTLWAVRYARHAMTGRVNPASIAADIDLARNLVDPASVLPALLAARDMAQALLDYHPPHAQFTALRLELARLRQGSQQDHHEPIAEGGTLRLGDRDPRVRQLRDRLGLPDPITTSSITHNTATSAPSRTDPVDIEAADAPDPDQFDAALDTAIRQFQSDHYLSADGIVGPATFAALNEQTGDLVPHIIANMERWRWMPRDLGPFHVLANIPEYRLWVVREGAPIFTTRTVVGQNRHRTAIFSDEMEYLAVNPYWNVPSSIARNELLPRILQDPGYLVRSNYDVLSNGAVVDPYAVNWQVAAQQGLPRIRQRPGSGNALGEIKFMFPNGHAIYFHDTPSRGLFARDQRAFSHGCVRVMDPWAFAEALLTNEPDWDIARLRSLRGPAERNMILSSHIPVHLTYFTARVDEDGRLIMARDRYGHHARVMQALGFAGS